MLVAPAISVIFKKALMSGAGNAAVAPAISVIFKKALMPGAGNSVCACQAGSPHDDTSMAQSVDKQKAYQDPLPGGRHDEDALINQITLV